MTRSWKRFVLAVALSPFLLVSGAGAVVLWDQSTFDLAGPGIANSNSPGFNGVVAYSVNDVTVSSPWIITKITQYYSAFNAGWAGGITQGLVYIQPKTGALPTVVPAGALSPMSGAFTSMQGQGVIAVSASGLNVQLAPGSYWIGITPNASAGINGVNLQWPAATTDAPVATYVSPGPWSNNYGNYDGAMLIEGDLPVPVAPSTWGGIKSLFE
jgi:hypothetical protein